ncbi:YggN family protein [Vibrio lentus]|uniref:Chemotaxis protein n=3 Tax=Vibrio lentus TaxID=136468 RepID=A0AA45AAA5_9VIBR|nr:YggN family protein [Vibrio lentus]MCB5357609.1 YggN family protein [Vibrio lentus]MCB5448077.1 YggN family protein [Vibrio lentus]MCB5459938.1 YggN family protein [Vibrio lentus]MCC4795013.1 YggN family protein [Vibrio lentus]MCC4851492.1 YggN family protein [Vibrio lentus]
MKKNVLIASLTVATAVVSLPTFAVQCRVDLKNELRIDEQKVEIHQVNGDTAILNGNNDLYIHGEKVALDADQQAAIEKYRDSMNEYLPRAKQMANDSLALANDVIDDIAASLDSPESFDNVKESMKTYFAELEARYYKDGELVLPANSFDSMANGWSEDFEKAKEIFNQEFISSAFDAMSEKMKQDGGLNLTEMADRMAELKLKVEERMKEHSQQVQEEANEFCDSLDEMAEQEQELHKIIPNLKDYQVFTI